MGILVLNHCRSSICNPRRRVKLAASFNLGRLRPARHNLSSNGSAIQPQRVFIAQENSTQGVAFEGVDVALSQATNPATNLD
jgi:hypothetical protein